MAGNKKRYNKALTKWDILRRAHYYSLPEAEGTTAIICSLEHIYKPDQLESPYNSYKANKELSVFRREALSLADRIYKSGRLAEVAINASSADFKAVLKDPTFASIQVIGHGCLSSINIKDEYGQGYFDWLDVSWESDHLKAGEFVQRTCGNFARGLSGPLGTFAMADHRRVIAPVAEEFTPRGLDHPQCRDLLLPVTDRQRMDYNYIKSTFR